MRVALFSNQFADVRGYGLARHARELFIALRGLGAECSVTPVAAWTGMPAAMLRERRRDTGLEILPWGRLGTPLAWMLAGRPPIEYWLPEEVDVVHVAALGYPVATRKPWVVTIHDLGPLVRPEFFAPKKRWLMHLSLEQAARRADALICVSESTAAEVEERAGRGVVSRIHVVPQGFNPMDGSGSTGATLPRPVATLHRRETPYFLVVGKPSPRKNQGAVVRALDALRDRLPHHLVLVGDERFANNAKAAPSLGDRVHRMGFVEDAALAALYAHATALVHVSLYEGFGLPVLEAMSVGCPVIASNVSSLPEVAGNAALLVDPASPDGVAEAMEAVATDAMLAARLRDAGHLRARAFSWARCARGTLGVYESLL